MSLGTEAGKSHIADTWMGCFSKKLLTSAPGEVDLVNSNGLKSKGEDFFSFCEVVWDTKVNLMKMTGYENVTLFDGKQCKTLTDKSPCMCCSS